MKVPKTSISMMVILGVAAVAVLGGVQSIRADGGIEPPPLGANEKQKGPAIIGTISLDGLHATFAGKCKGNDVNVGPIDFPANLVNVTEQTMTNVRLPSSGPAGCYSTTGGEETIINTVNKLTKFGNPVSQVTADVVLQFIIVQP
jgi:hypothetical protein